MKQLPPGSEEQLRLLFESNPQPMIIYDRETLEILEANDAAVSISGYSHTECLSMTLKDMWPADAIEMQTTLVTGERPPFRHSRGWKSKWKNGKIVDAEVSSHTLDFKGRKAAVAVAHDITELVETGRALRQYQALADNTRDIILFVRQSDTRIVEANAAAVNEYGYTREELLSMNIDSIRSPAEKDWTPEQFEQANNGGLMFEAVHIRRDGTTFPVEISSRTITIDGIQTIISVVRDITARREADRRLERQEQVLRLFVENSPAAVAMFDRDMRYIVASRRYLSNYNLGEIDLVGRSHYEVFPEIPERWKEVHGRCLAGKIEKCDEEPFTRGDGTVDWVKWEIHPWYENAGQIGGVILFSEVVNDRKRAAEELEISRQRLVGLIHSAMDGIISLDENQRIVIFNPAAEKMFGVGSAEMIGQTLERLIPEKFRETHSVQVTRFGNTGKWDESRRMMGMRMVHGLRANGETFPLEASISQIEVGGRKIFTVICRDVTEQVRAREELRLSEEKYRTLYENSTVGIYRTTPDGRILLANPALVKMLGYSSFEHLATRNLKETGFEPSYPRKDFLKVIEEYGEVKGLESAWRKLDGEVIHLRENARAVRDISGRTMYFDGVVEDITQRKESEVKIRRLNRVYAVLSDINQIIVRVRDKQRLFEEACRVAVEVGKFRFVWIGVVDERESILKPVAKAGEDEGSLAPVRVPIVPKTKEQAGPIFKVVSEGTPVVRNDIEHDGMTFPWQSEALKRGFRSSASFPLKNSNHVFGTINFYSTDTGFFDPQEVMLLEELSSDISYAVENIEVEGQRKSLQAQLIQAQKMESLGTLAGGIAHDFNNILGIIMGYSTYIDAKDQSPEKLSRSANAIRRAAERGAILVKQLLTFARKDEMKFESAQVNDVVTEVDGLLKEILPRTIKVVTDLEPKLPPLTADATQIQQVLLNICLNARDAMPAGGTITIMTRSLDREMSATKFPAMRPEESLAIIIKDTGIGMSEEIKRRIFDPFFTTKEVGKGTGLGLALVHSIITSQNGLVEVESEPGKGSTFTIYLSVQERGSEKVEQHDLLGYDTQGGSETVLVLEDEELLMDLITNVLSSKGYVVLAAQNGQEGIDVFIRRRSEIAVVIADLGLPGLSGEEALKRIRDADPDVKLIAASGFIEPRVRSGLMDIGVAHFVHKPYTPAEILKTLRDVLDNES